MRLLREQIEYLQQNFRLSPQSVTDSVVLQSVEQLFDPAICQKYLQEIAQEFNTPSLLVVASQFAKRYTYMLAPSTLYAMSVYHKGLQVDPKNCYIEPAYEHGFWCPKLVLDDWKGTVPTQDRSEWREEIITQLFDNLARMWSVLNECTRIQPAILWENTVVYIHWLYQQQLADHEQAKQDYHYLLHAEASVFGTSFQPFQRFPLTDGCRKTCCLFFLTNEAQRVCKGCPRRKERQVNTRSVMVTS